MNVSNANDYNDLFQAILQRLPERLRPQINHQLYFRVEILRHPPTIRVVKILLELVSEPNWQTQAISLLERVRAENSINQICRTWLDTRHSALEKLLLSKGWVTTKGRELIVYTALKH